MRNIVRERGRMFLEHRGALDELFDLTFRVLDVEQDKNVTILDLELAPQNSYRFGFLGTPAIFKGDKVQLFSNYFGSQSDLSIDISEKIRLMVVYSSDRQTDVFDYHRLKYQPEGMIWKKRD